MSRYDEASQSDDLSREAIEDEMERILASEKFTRSGKLRSFLRFTVTQTLLGNAETLKEYVIGTEVLEKPASYDPRSDSLVRVLASRLRARLRQYYSNGGSRDPLVIDLPKGGYVPIFQKRERFQAGAEKRIATRNLTSRGRFRASKLSKEAIAQSVEDFQEAIAGDPGWSVAYGNLANAHILQAFLGFERPLEVWTLAHAAAETAVGLDDLTSDHHVSLGLIQAFYAWNWKDAEHHFEKAIARDSYSAIAPLWRVLALLIPAGRLSEATSEIRRSWELSPSSFVDEARALGLYLSNQHDSVLELAARGPNGEVPGGWLGWVRSLALAALGRYAAAISLLERLIEMNPDDTQAICTLAYAHAAAGDPAKALELRALLEEKRQRGIWVSNYDLATIQAGLGNSNEAVGLLQESVKQKEPWALYLTVDPRLKSLSTVARFGSLKNPMMMGGLGI